MLNKITDNQDLTMQEIIGLVLEQYPDRQDLVVALQNSVCGHWRDKAYFQFVNSANANEPDAEWQHADSIVVELQSKGDIVIDLLKDGRIGGLEFIDLIDK